jgi:hypothetical protein
MSCLAFPPLLFYWMLDFTLAPVFPLVSCQKIFTRIPDLQLVQTDFFVVQSIHIHRFDDGFDWMCALNSK